jgi:hypothetical protein
MGEHGLLHACLQPLQPLVENLQDVGDHLRFPCQHQLHLAAQQLIVGENPLEDPGDGLCASIVVVDKKPIQDGLRKALDAPPGGVGKYQIQQYLRRCGAEKPFMQRKVFTQKEYQLVRIASVLLYGSSRYPRHVRGHQVYVLTTIPAGLTGRRPPLSISRPAPCSGRGSPSA